MDLDLDGNAALLIASSSGLGKASAKALAKEGVNVVINGRDRHRLKKAIDDIESVARGDVIGQIGDITRQDDIKTLVEQTIEQFGRLDHLVTSAGGPEPMEPLEPDDEDWFRAYELLVMSVVRVVQEAAPHLRSDGGGTITMVTSKVIKEASEDNVLSSSVRMAVAGYAKALSKKLAPEVRTNIVLPGAHETPRLNDYDESTRSTVVENIPINRLGNPQELGDMVAYLSSPRSGFTNGEAIILDGGSGKSTF